MDSEPLLALLRECNNALTLFRKTKYEGSDLELRVRRQLGLPIRRVSTMACTSPTESCSPGSVVVPPHMRPRST